MPLPHPHSTWEMPLASFAGPVESLEPLWLVSLSLSRRGCLSENCARAVEATTPGRAWDLGSPHLSPESLPSNQGEAEKSLSVVSGRKTITWHSSPTAPRETANAWPQTTSLSFFSPPSLLPHPYQFLWKSHTPSHLRLCFEGTEPNAVPLRADTVVLLKCLHHSFAQNHPLAARFTKGKNSPSLYHGLKDPTWSSPANFLTSPLSLPLIHSTPLFSSPWYLSRGSAVSYIKALASKFPLLKKLFPQTSTRLAHVFQVSVQMSVITGAFSNYSTLTQHTYPTSCHSSYYLSPTMRM